MSLVALSGAERSDTGAIRGRRQRIRPSRAAHSIILDGIDVLTTQAGDSVALPAFAIVIDTPRSVRRDRRQSRRIPALAAPDALPASAGLERALGGRRRRVTQRTAHRSHRRQPAVLCYGGK